MNQWRVGLGIVRCSAIAIALTLCACPEHNAPCDVDADCLEGELCLQGRCKTKCVHEGDCRSDEVCVEALCRTACTSNQQCRGDERCTSGACMPDLPVDAGGVDRAAPDTRAPDISLPDAVQLDATALDTSSVDSVAADAASYDASQADTSRVDATFTDTPRADVLQGDTSVHDAGLPDALGADTAQPDASGLEVCPRDCVGKCGGADDGCGGQCQAACPGGQWCNVQACEPCTVDEHCGPQCSDCSAQVLDKVCVGSEPATAHCGCTDASQHCAPGQTCPADLCQGNFDQCALGLDDCDRCSEDCVDATDVGTTSIGWRWSCECREGFFGNPLDGCALVHQTSGHDDIVLAPRAEPYNLTREIFDPRRSCADGVAYSVIELTSTSARLSPTPEVCCFYNRDDVVLINLQGSSSSVANVGNWEKLTVSSFSGNRINFHSKNRFYGENADDDSNIGIGPDQQRVMLVRAPYYDMLTVQPGATLTADGWDGLRGGVLAMHAQALHLHGSLEMEGKGFGGGAPACGDTGSDRAQPGESIAGPGIVSGGDPVYWQAAASYNYGGGGGGCFVGGTASLGGGGGGYGTIGWSLACSGSCVEACQWSAAGGLAYGEQNLVNRIFLGSGGGGGGGLESSCGATAGGAGGGVLILEAQAELIVSGTMSADGTGAGAGARPGGAGAGGAIYIWTMDSAELGDKLVTALGGLAEAGGADGGDGRIMVYHETGQSLSGETDPPAYELTW